MDDATRADSVPFDAMKVMLAFQRLERQTHGAGLCRRGAARHGARLRPVTSMISRSRVAAAGEHTGTSRLLDCLRRRRPNATSRPSQRGISADLGAVAR